MSWTPVAPADDLWDGDMTSCVAQGRRILLLKLDGEIHAYEDRCAHLGVPLSTGHLEGGVLTCSAHHYEYDARTGRGVNPRSAGVRAYPVKVESGRILVDTSGVPEASGASHDGVGPVLEAGETARAIVAAIRLMNVDVEVRDRGSYLRVLVPGRCVVTRQAIESALGRTFRLPKDLELVMPSFQGRFCVTEDDAVWCSEAAR